MSMFMIAATAQNNGPADPKRGAANGASFSISDIENINLTNGNLMLNMPMVSLPPSRGGLSASYGMSYNSKNLKPIIESLQIDNRVHDRNLLYESDAASWRLVTSLQYSLKVTNRFALGQAMEIACEDGSIYTKNGYRWKVQVQFPDGSEKEFRPVGYADFYSDGYFNVSPNGLIAYYGYQFIPPSSHTCNYNQGQHNGPMSYISTDGSYIRMIVQHDSDGDDTNNPFTLHFADGSTYSSETGTQTDRYGNSLAPITESTYCQGQPALDGVQDQMGRKVFYTGRPGGGYFICQLGFNGGEVAWTVKTKTIYVRRPYTATALPGLRDRGGQPGPATFIGQFEVVDEIIPPTGNELFKYEFVYDGSDIPLGKEDYSPGWGQLVEIKMPSGARALYTYNSVNDETDKILERSVSSKTLIYNEEYDGQVVPAPDQVWIYSVGPTSTTVSSPDGSQILQEHGATSYDHPHNGLVKKIVNPDGSMVEKVWSPAGNVNPLLLFEVTTLPGGTQALMKKFTYDQNGNTRTVNEYGIIPASNIPRNNPNDPPNGNWPYAPERTTETTYYNATPDYDPNNPGPPGAYHYSQFNYVRNLVKSVEVRSGSTPGSRTEMMYDNQPYGVTYQITTGNLTSQRRWDSTKGDYSNPLGSNSITTSTVYGIGYGLPTSMTDALGRTTVLTYGAIGPYAGPLYPTQVVTASGTSVARTMSTAYDFYTGLPTSNTDVDNGATTTTSYDTLGRPTGVTAPNGATTSTGYDDIGRKVITRSDVETAGDQKKVVTTFYDQLGRVRLAKTLELEESPTHSATDERHGIKVQTRYRTTSGLTCQLTSNPYRADFSTNENQATMGWTLSATTSNGLQSSVTTFSGTSLPTGCIYSGANSTGTVSTSISGNATTVTDQAGKQRRSITNALGQLVQVDEPDANGNLTLSTTYQYDTLNNLTHVDQGPGIPQRIFAYSSLSRLTSANNPESGTILYQYDNNGNLTQKTDARPVTTTYVYDALNRVTNRNYNDGTPNVVYTYDLINGSPAPNARGRLTKVSSAVSTTEYLELDILGRVTRSKQTTDGVEYGGGVDPTKWMTYSYFVSGALKEQQYPSGRVVKNTVDADGDLSIVETKKNAGASFSNYASQFSYNAAKAMTGMQLGNGLWESTTFNSRMQPEQIALGTSQNGTNKLQLNYGYGSSQNNGNVMSQTITVPGLAQPFVQNYTYDEMNRLKTATETNNGSQTWTQVFGYDRYGNRNITSGLGVTNFSFSGNRITAHTYDLAGNTLNFNDGTGRTFTYDAENKQKTAVVNGYTNEYFYDGDGRRVKKVVPSTGETTIFVYDAMGRTVAEYSTIVEPAATAKVAYLTADHLGSPRINTDQTGAVTARHDYHPFGEEISTSQRTAALGYSADTVRKQFTGYERDNEIEMDFAQARYYNSQHGRFTGVDPLLSTGSIYNPQTWNRYSYTLNSPLKYTDPSGMYICDGDKKQCKNIEEGMKKAQAALKKLDPKSDQYKALDRALKTYGAAGVDNGLTIKFGATVTGAPAETSGLIREDKKNLGNKLVTADNPTGRDLVITFDPKQFSSASDYAGTIGHEGSHVADRTDFIGALPVNLGSDAATKMFESSPLNLTKYDTETRAYGVSAAVARGQGFDSLTIGKSKHEIWNSGWKEADRMKKQGEGIDKVLAEPKSKGGLYEVTKANPGPRFY